MSCYRSPRVSAEPQTDTEASKVKGNPSPHESPAPTPSTPGSTNAGPSSQPKSKAEPARNKTSPKSTGRPKEASNPWLVSQRRPSPESDTEDDLQPQP